MEGVKLYGGPSIAVLLQNERLRCPSELVDPLWLHTSEPSFQGSKSLVNFENVGGGSRVTADNRTFFQALEKEEKVVDDDDYEGCFHQQGKKRRLTSEQVQSLERNFEAENKLEPERKVQLAKELRLQPRQVAIWFQNRRARFKTKQIEKDYGALKASYDKLKADHDNLLQENHKLKEEVDSLKKRLIPRGKEEESLGDKFSDAANSKHMGLISNAGCENNESKVGVSVMNVILKQEDANSSAKSDVLDSDSPNYTDGNHSSLVEPADSDFSQDEEDHNHLSHHLLTGPFLPKVEDGCYDEPHVNSCNFGFPVEDQAFGFWSY